MLKTIKARMRASWLAGLVCVLGVAGLNAALLWLVESRLGGAQGAGEATAMLGLAMRINLGVGAAMVVGVVVGVLYFEGLIVGALGRMSAAMRRLAAADYEVEIPGADRQDEIGEMARSMAVFRENGLARARLEAEAQAMHQEVDRRLKETEAAFEAAGRDQKRVVEAMARELSKLADGDLSARLEAEVAAEYAQLREDFNAAVGRLAAVVGSIAAAAQEIRSGSGEIAHAADDLSRRTEQQAAVWKRPPQRWMKSRLG